MSMSPFVKAWASQFFAKGIGLANVPDSINDDTITIEYRKNFEEPAKRFMKLNKLSDNDAKQFLTELKSNKLYSALYILPALNPVDAETWQVSLRESIKEFTSKHTPYFGMFTGANTCIVCYVDMNKCEVVGTYPGLGSLYPLIPLQTKGVNGDAVTYLCRKDPVMMSEQEIAATEYLMTCGAVSREQLNTALFYMPSGETKVVRADELKDIPYVVRKLIKELPPALATEHGGNVYEAARAYAVKNPNEYSEELTWLDTLFRGNSGIIQGTIPTQDVPIDVNDATVKAYLVEHYGMNPDWSLGMLFSSPVTYLSSDAVASAIKSEGIDKVMDTMQEDPNYLTGTLDNLIADYCKEEGIDLKCTISQLIHYINYDCKITPPDMAAVIGDFIAQNPDFPMATTVEEILTNTPHKYVDDFDTCMEFIDSCANIDGSVKRALRQALLDNTPLSIPENSVTQEDICAAIDARNIPEETKLLLIGVIEGTITADELRKPLANIESQERSFWSYVDELDVPSEVKVAIEGLANGTVKPKDLYVNNVVRVLSDRERAVRASAEYILNGFRDYLLAGDTNEKRLAGQSILYSYLKILYAGRSSVDEDREFLLNKVSTCTDEGVKKILEEAINIYSQ